MAIVFPHKIDKKKSILVDALRIIAWEEYRSTNKAKLKDLEYGGYEIFADEWKSDEIHNFTFENLLAFIEELGWTINELLNYRINYYIQKRQRAIAQGYSYTTTADGDKDLQYVDEENSTLNRQKAEEKIPF
jgi:hypothetical protein